MNLPKVIRIGPRSIPVIVENSEGDTKGEFRNGEIRIVRGLSPIDEADTFLHEVVHAIWDAYAIGGGDKLEERAALCIARGMIDVMANSPSVLAYLRAALQRRKSE